MVLGPEGFSYSGSTSNENIGQPFYRRAGSSQNYNVGGSWSTIFTSPDFSIPKKSQLVMNFRVPIRQDSYGWGGCYIRTFYRIDSGSWVDCGNSGYTTAMGSGKRMISGHDHMQTFDFLNKSSNFTLGGSSNNYYFDITLGNNYYIAAGDTSHHNMIIALRRYEYQSRVVTHPATTGQPYIGHTDSYYLDNSREK